ncbi:MAG TPA: phage Gp37/Gp68 family protein [Rhizomicrobium sp.]|jgi:protein gp37
MAEKTGISWCDATFNPWMGCTKVSPACDNCYAEKLVTGRMGKDLWGAGKPRHRTSVSNWKKARQWNKTPAQLIGSQWPGRKPRVFAASLADIFDNEIDPAWRDDFWALVRETPNLQWLIVTKRIGNAAKMLPADWGNGYPNVTLIITVANQPEADRDVIKLLLTPALSRGLSVEPMLGHMHLGYLGWPASPSRRRDGYNALIGARYDNGGMVERLPKLDWVICGGESGPGARPMHPNWARALRDQCAAAEIPFHFKQWGEWAPADQVPFTGFDHKGHAVATPNSRVLIGGKDFSRDKSASNFGEGAVNLWRYGKGRTGRLLDGAEHNGFQGAT